MNVLHDRFFFFFFNDTATTEIYTLSLHDALPILAAASFQWRPARKSSGVGMRSISIPGHIRSEEHTSELQSPCNLVCRLLLEKKKKKTSNHLRISYTQYTQSRKARYELLHMCNLG